MSNCVQIGTTLGENKSGPGAPFEIPQQFLHPVLFPNREGNLQVRLATQINPCLVYQERIVNAEEFTRAMGGENIREEEFIGGSCLIASDYVTELLESL